MIQFDYLFRKILFALITLAIVIVFNFFLFRILPGDPVKLLFRNPRLTKQVQETIRVQFGLDKPVWINTQRLQSGDVGGMFDSQFGAYINVYVLMLPAIYQTGCNNCAPPPINEIHMCMV